MHKPLIIVLLLVLVAVLCACRSDTTVLIPTTSSGEPGEQFSARAPLMAKAENQEDAEAIAELYGITLVEFKRNLALFHTDEDPREVIKRGQENGWPELSLNYAKQLH